MLLHAVIVPPPDVLAAVSHVLLSIDSVAEAAPVQQPARSRWRRAKEPPSPSSNAADHELDVLPTTLMQLPIAGFGNVTAADAGRLADAMKAAATEWACPTVHVAGGGALEFPDDRSVWVKLDGDVDALMAVARGVVQSVASRGFFVDRRKFRPWLAVATITDSTTAPYLEHVVAALEAFRGEPWTIEWVTVTKPSFDPALAESLEVYRIPLATP